jgi:hypothetical protein
MAKPINKVNSICNDVKNDNQSVGKQVQSVSQRKATGKKETQTKKNNKAY